MCILPMNNISTKVYVHFMSLTLDKILILIAKNRHKYKARVSTGLRISISIGRMVEERCIDYRIIKKNLIIFFRRFQNMICL